MGIKSMPELRLGKHKPRFPLVQGGMGVRISGPNLAGAVANAGGVGTIATVGLAVTSSDYNGKNYFEANRREIIRCLHKAKKEAPSGIIAVNIMVALTDYEDQVRASCEGGADVIISGAGLPLGLPEITKDFSDVALVPIVSSLKAVRIIVKRWEKNYGRLPDGFVVESPLYAGGHLGVTKEEQVYSPEFSPERVIPEIKEYLEKELKVDIPIIAAGGVWDRADMFRMFDLGASGVQMGTRFMTSVEGDASEEYKDIILRAKDNDVVIIKSPVGIPGRVLRSPFIDRYLKGDVDSKPCIANCLHHCSYRKGEKTFCIAQALVDAFFGRWEDGLFFCGTNVSKLTKKETVSEIFKDLFEE